MYASPWVVPDGVPRLESGVPHVWAIDIAYRGEQDQAVLPSDERQRAERFGTPELRGRWIATRVALRTILAGYLDLDPRAVPLVISERGKPHLEPRFESDLTFNLSHSGDLAMVVVGRGGIGVDIEKIRPFDQMDRFVARFFADEEGRGLYTLPPDERVIAFFRCWTRKEAILKAIGVGLQAPLDAVVVDWNDEPAPRVRAVPAGPNVPPPEEWSLRNVPLGANFAGAIASDLPIENVAHLVWQRRTIL